MVIFSIISIVTWAATGLISVKYGSVDSLAEFPSLKDKEKDEHILPHHKNQISSLLIHQIVN